MSDDTARPSPEEIILYEKDPATKIATITLNRPDKKNPLTFESYAERRDIDAA